MENKSEAYFYQDFDKSFGTYHERDEDIHPECLKEKDHFALTETQNSLTQPVPDPGQPLSACVKNRLRPYFSRVNLDDIRVHEGIPSYVVGDPLAYAEEDRIYFKKGRYDPHSVAGLSDIGHEVTHSEQYAKLGTRNFQAQYLGQYLELRRLGFDHETAYENITFEVEARKRAEIIRKDLTNLMRDFGGRDPCPR